ncbi:DoxX family protein [Streptomyces sp. NPDC006365]|uniref:Rv1678 family membrane protein n=1 Tax=Streptomyces sp. NPDC006365 TaxID=3364744 RepID=UPI003691B67D
MPDTPQAERTRTPGLALVRWFFAPATDPVPRQQAVAAAFLRILLGLMWLYNVAWKRPPDFGEDTNTGLYKFTAFAVSDPVLPPYSWIVEHAVLPNIEVFGWGVLISETALAVLLLTGAWVRPAALLGVAQSLAIGLSVAYGPHEWPWAYWLMTGGHVVILFSSAGRAFAVDAVRSRTGSARSLGLVWGAVAVVAGAVTVLGTAGDDPLDPRGYVLGSADPSVSLGAYNLVGGIVLLVAGALVLVATLGRVAFLGWAAALVGVGAALSLYAQIGFNDPSLGGTATSAAFLLSVAVVAVTVAAAQGRTSPSPRD